MIRENLEAMGLCEEAVVFVMKLWESIQFLDDVKDGDELKDVDRNIYRVLVELPCDPFFQRNSAAIGPAMAVAFHKWRAANWAESQRTDLDRAYMWRAGFYDVVLLCFVLTMPPDDVPTEALMLYGETREDYVKEFSDA